MKVIFLDIDGVMATGSYPKRSTVYEGAEFNPICVKNLNEIMQITGAKIVVSSSWRKLGFWRVRQIFHYYGVDVIGQTPVLDYGIRGDEIRLYLEESPWRIERFIILDDKDNMGELLPYLVQTNWYTGLDERAKNQAIRMLLSV